MSILNRSTSRRRGADVASRRSFVVRIGAGVSAALVPTVGAAGVPPAPVYDPALRLAILEDENALRQLHQAFEQAMDKERYEDVIGMFADDAEVTFNGGIFRSRTRGVTRFYRDLFQTGKSGKRMEPAPGFELAADQQPERVHVSPDRLSATGFGEFHPLDVREDEIGFRRNRRIELKLTSR